MDSNTRHQLARAAVILSAGSNSNTPAHARRLARTKFQVDFYEVELECAAAELAAESFRDFARITGKVRPC
jgi:hypothetical protein